MTGHRIAKRIYKNFERMVQSFYDFIHDQSIELVFSGTFYNDKSQAVTTPLLEYYVDCSPSDRVIVQEYINEYERKIYSPVHVQLEHVPAHISYFTWIVIPRDD